MQRAGFMDHVVIIPNPTDVYTYWSDADTELRIVFAKEPRTTYRLSINAQAPDRIRESSGAVSEPAVYDRRFVTLCYAGNQWKHRVF